MKKIVIFGDSYSTFDGYVPEHYASYYPKLDVLDVEQTWWRLLCKDSGCSVKLNDSWGGTTVCNTGYKGDCSKTSSFIFRLEQRIQEGFFKNNDIDKVFVFGGTNDAWTENACGELQFSDWSEKDLFLILPGYSYFINRLSAEVGKEKIHVIINSDIRDDVTRGIIDICRHYDISYTMLKNISKSDGHPDISGMTEIKNQVLQSLGW